jgi:hypothetical protein
MQSISHCTEYELTNVAKVFSICKELHKLQNMGGFQVLVRFTRCTKRYF